MAAIAATNGQKNQPLGFESANPADLDTQKLANTDTTKAGQPQGSASQKMVEGVCREVALQRQQAEPGGALFSPIAPYHCGTTVSESDKGIEAGETEKGGKTDNAPDFRGRRLTN